MHLAEIFGEVPLSTAQRRRAIEILKRNLETSSDWIVINDSMQTLAGFAATDPELRDWLLPVVADSGMFGSSSGRRSGRAA